MTPGRVQPILAQCIGLTLALDTLSPSRQGRRASKASAKPHRIRNDCKTQYSLHSMDQADICCGENHVSDILWCDGKAAELPLYSG